MVIKPNKNTEKINAAMDMLLDAIHTSEIYERYEAARLRLKEEPGAYERVNEFRGRAYNLQKRRELYNSQDEIRELYRCREMFREDAVMNEYLEAELEMCRLMQRLTLDIIGSVNLELISLEDTING